MKHSIKRFLLFYLLLSITLTSSLTTIGNYFLDNHTLEHHFDQQLSQTVYFIRALIGPNPGENYINRLRTSIANLSHATNDNSQHSYGLDRMQFRIWDKKGNLLLATPDAPSVNAPPEEMDYGFSTLNINHHTWRILLAKPQPHSPFVVLIAERYEVRSNLAHELTWGNLFMLLWSYPLFGLLIWLSVDRGLLSLKRLTASITNRHTTDFNTVDITDVPLEVKPLVEALNKLFIRLHDTFERNRRFSSDAAHELRTPLAALKTQVQVALKAPSDNERKQGLQNVILGVDRCTHIVHQLLILSRLAPEATLNDVKEFNLSDLAAEIVGQLAPAAVEKNTDIELIQDSSKDIFLIGNETAVAILMRNLIDNAIRYTPENGIIKVEITEKDHEVDIVVSDSGPGIPKELRERVFERFYRVLGTQASGSGLGLAIVQQIAELHGAHITLGTPPHGKGLEITVSFPKDRVMTGAYCSLEQ